MKQAKSKNSRAHVAHKTSTPATTPEPSPAPDGWSRIAPLYPALWTGKSPIVGVLVDVEPVDRETQQLATVLIALEATEVEDRAANKLRQGRRGEPVHVLGACLLKLRALKSEAGYPVLRIQRAPGAKTLVVDQRNAPMTPAELQALIVEGQTPPAVPQAPAAVS